MWVHLAIAAGAGFVAALLFALVVAGSPLGLALSYLAPLPIFIAALGWNHRSGLMAASFGFLAMTALFRLEAGLAFLLGSALPAWGLAYLALLGRPYPKGVEWYPLGNLLMAVAAAGSLITLLGMVALGDGDFETAQKLLGEGLETIFKSGADHPVSVAQREWIDVLLWIVPLAASAVFAALLTLNLWLAAKVVSVSQRLPRPWPMIAKTKMPKIALAVIAAAFAGAWLPGFAGAFGLALAGAFLLAFALQGLAVLHETTRGRQGRLGLLVAAYALVAALGQIFLPVLALIGIADTAFNLRHRLIPSS